MLLQLLNFSNKNANTLIGTCNYVAPELCDGKPYNIKSDIWSLGCILFELCAMEKMFEGTVRFRTVFSSSKILYPLLAFKCGVIDSGWTEKNDRYAFLRVSDAKNDRIDASDRPKRSSRYIKTDVSHRRFPKFARFRNKFRMYPPHTQIYL
jgi:serine/threonine protein kinase